MFRKIGTLVMRNCSGVDPLWVTEAIAMATLLGLVFIPISSAFGESVEYPVSPGDTLYVSVWGHEELSGSMTVGPDGTVIFPPPVGSVYVSQLTVDAIAELLTEKLEEYVKQPVVTVSIRGVQGFVVHVLGQVQSPSFYRIPDGTSIQELITRANGFTTLADPRSIILIRKEGEKVERRKIDFSRFLEQNDMESNPILIANDVVVVPRADMREKMQQLVTVVGQVGAPGSYELENPILLLDVLTLAGGALSNADLKNVFILNRSEGGEQVSRHVDLEAVLSGRVNPHAPVPTISPGDIVFIPDMSMREDRAFSVNVIGQVVNPGSYTIAEGTRLVDAVFKAGGLADEASIENIGVIHTKYASGLNGGSAISLFSLKDYLLTGDLAANPVLSEGDTVVIPMTEAVRTIPPVQTAFSSSITVNVIGEVAKPGVYRLSAESNLLHVLTLAGGPTTNADLERTMIIRGDSSQSATREQRFRIDLEEVMTEGNLDTLLAVLPGDTVFIPKAKERRNWWRSVIQLTADISSIVVLYYLLIGRTYRR